MTDRRFYLGPGRPLNSLATWQDIELAASGGLLGERQWVELKKSLGPSKKEVNTELARDLAALSVDGGLLIFGIADDQSVVGCDPSSLTTRVSQVAATVVSPPLSPLIHDPVYDPSGTRAVVLVEVPPSANAPHMVDGLYWGRSSDGKRVLSDPEVRRLLAERQHGLEGFEKDLATLVELDPLARYLAEPGANGHLYFLAQPCAPVLHRDRSARIDLIGHLRALDNPTRWHFGHLQNCDRNAYDPDGEARMTLDVREGSVSPEHGRSLAYVSVKDDCRVVVLSGGATSDLRVEGGPAAPKVLQSLVALVTMQALQLLKRLGDEWAYTGQWRVGLHVSGLDGKPAHVNNFAFNQVNFPAPAYTRTEVLDPAAWADSGESIADQLLRGFLRGLGMQNWTLKQALGQ